MRALIYKRTHDNDPDPRSGIFGSSGGKGCMGQVRRYEYDAVIGVGGISAWPRREGIAGRVTWIGIGPHRYGDPQFPKVGFDHFKHYGKNGEFLQDVAPKQFKRIYIKKVRLIMSSNLKEDELAEADAILDRARNAPPSGKGSSAANPRSNGCPPKSGDCPPRSKTKC